MQQLQSTLIDHVELVQTVRSSTSLCHELFEQQDSRYEASMLRDLEKGGAIEAEHILGFMLKKCRDADLDDTLHRLAYTHAKAYEERRAAQRLPQRA